MTDRWTAQAEELLTETIRALEKNPSVRPVMFLSHMQEALKVTAAALKAAYAQGVEDAAKVEIKHQGCACDCYEDRKLCRQMTVVEIMELKDGAK